MDVPHIPEEIISQILPRIPPKDLNRFKRVCKLWKSLISDLKFVKSCLTHTQPDLMFQAFDGPCYKIFSVNILDENVKVEKLEVPPVMDSFKRDQLMLLSSCDGLLLLQNSIDPQILHVYKPTTGQYKNLPRFKTMEGVCLIPACFCKKKKKLLGKECSRSFKFTLGFDDSTGQYKVFGIEFNKYDPAILTLLLETDCHWNRLGFSDYLQVGSPSPLILVGKEVHFVVMDSEACYFLIYSIETTAGGARETVFPYHLIKDEYYHSLSQMKGSLCVTFVYEFELEMWVLDDSVKSSWSKYYEINLKSLSKKPTYIPMKSKKKKQKPPTFKSFFNNDNLFVAAGDIGKHLSDVVRIILHDNDRLFMYDLKSQELKEVAALDHKLALCDFDPVFHINSLVSWK